MMVGQRARSADDPATVGCNVGHLPGRRHVASLALYPRLAGRTFQPFRIGGVNGHAEDRSFVTGSTVAAVLVDGRVGILRAIGVFQRAEETLAARRPRKLQREP